MRTLVDMMTHQPSYISDKMDVVYVSRVLKKIGSSYHLYDKAEVRVVVS